MVHPKEIEQSELNCTRATYLGYNGPTLETKLGQIRFRTGKVDIAMMFFESKCMISSGWTKKQFAVKERLY